MTVQQQNAFTQLQRVQVEPEFGVSGGAIKIRVENFDEALGWYTSGSLSLTANQLPLLEQALQAMRSFTRFEESVEEKIVAFPGRMSEFVGNAN